MLPAMEANFDASRCRAASCILHPSVEVHEYTSLHRTCANSFRVPRTCCVSQISLGLHIPYCQLPLLLALVSVRCTQNTSRLPQNLSETGNGVKMENLSVSENGSHATETAVDLINITTSGGDAQPLCASCDRCRARKTKCDGKRPCSNCVFKYMKKNKIER